MYNGSSGGVLDCHDCLQHSRLAWTGYVNFCLCGDGASCVGLVRVCARYRRDAPYLCHQESACHGVKQHGVR
jgi:hypothetical protein